MVKTNNIGRNREIIYGNITHTNTIGSSYFFSDKEGFDIGNEGIIYKQIRMTKPGKEGLPLP
jgi:hypothetical protein